MHAREIVRGREASFLLLYTAGMITMLSPIKGLICKPENILERGCFKVIFESMMG